MQTLTQRPDRFSVGKKTHAQICLHSKRYEGVVYLSRDPNSTHGKYSDPGPQCVIFRCVCYPNPKNSMGRYKLLYT